MCATAPARARLIFGHRPLRARPGEDWNSPVAGANLNVPRPTEVHAEGSGLTAVLDSVTPSSGLSRAPHWLHAPGGPAHWCQHG